MVRVMLLSQVGQVFQRISYRSSLERGTNRDEEFG